MKFFFLHIGKTGGSAVQHALRSLAREDIVLCGHDVSLNDVPHGAKAVASIRHPVDRFVSGFYSRLRQGLPRYNAPWSEAEAKGFARFKTANALAEALWSSDPEEELQARALKASHIHMRSAQQDWLGEIGYLSAPQSPLAMIMHQSELSADFERVKQMIGAAHARLPTDPLNRHDNPQHFNRSLSARAVANLSQWYEKDIRFYADCLALRETMIAQIDAQYLLQEPGKIPTQL